MCSRTFRSELANCPDDDSMLIEAAPNRSRINEIVGNYRLLRVVGEGGAGTVFEAEHVQLGRRMAIKLLHRDAVTEEIAIRFFNEARAVNEIHHANIIDVEDFVTTPDGEHYMVMELLVGEDLRSAITRDHVLSPERVAALGEQVASALAAVHRVGILHRDLKPDNIFLVHRDGVEVAKLLDFGIAKFTEESGVTRAGMTMGTPQYMAPERIITGAEVGTLADIYALGMVLYEALVGQPAFNSPTLATVLRAHCYEPVEPPSQRLGAPVPPVLEAAILKCLEKLPEHRFTTADELAIALRADTPVTLARSSIRRIATKPQRAPRGRSTQLAFAVLIASVALAIHLWPHPRAPMDEAAGAPGGSALASAAPSVTDDRAAAPPAPAPAPPPPPPVRAVEAPPATITVAITSTPAGAKVLLAADRTEFGTAPVTATLPKSTQPVSLIARFPDGTEVIETIVPDRSRDALVFTKPRPKLTAKATTPLAKQAPRPTAKSPPADRDDTLDPFKP